MTQRKTANNPQLLNPQKKLVPGTIPYIEWQMAQAGKRPFPVDNAAIKEDIPPPDSDWLRGRELEGVSLIIYTLSGFEMKSFEGRPPRETVTYAIYVVNRPELGLRKLSLQSRAAIHQAHELEKDPNNFPFIATCEVLDPEKGQWSSLWLGPAWEKPKEYYHQPWGEYRQDFVEGEIVNEEDYPF
jgi:hypothetical protein